MLEITMLQVAIFFGIATTTLWVILFVGFLFGYKNKVDVSQYFRAMFLSYKKSEMRVVWKSIILGLEYIIGLVFTSIVISAWYVAQAIRTLVSKIIFSKAREERLELEKLADEVRQDD